MNREAEFDTPTESQRARDTRIVDTIRSRYLAPLLDELEEAVPGYKAMDELSKVDALKRLNDATERRGERLLAKFIPMAEFFVYSGVDEEPWIHQGTSPGITVGYMAENCDFLSVLDALKNERRWRPNYSLPFRVALVAEALRQNVVIDSYSAYSFAAGIDEEPTLQRFTITEAVDHDGDTFGWTITIRDTWPTDTFMKYIASMLRGQVKHAESLNSRLEEYGYETLFRYTERERIRKPRENTMLLLQFINDELPARKMNVAKNGVGRKVQFAEALREYLSRRPGDSDTRERIRISWESAYRLFDEQYPALFKNAKSFENSYRNAERVRNDNEVFHAVKNAYRALQDADTDSEEADDGA